MKKRILFVLCVLLIFSTGCWDNFENRGYVLGVAIDDYPPLPKGQVPEAFESAAMDANLETGTPLYAMTIQMPIIKKASMLPSAGGGGGGGGGKEESRTWQLTQVGNSFASMNQNILARTSWPPYYEHLQAIIISENVAKKGIQKVLDFFIRDPQMRRRTNVFISKGDAKAILDVIPVIEDYSAIYLAKIDQNARQSPRIVYGMDLGEAMGKIHADECFILPRVEASKHEVKDSGAAVFKHGKMVAWMDEIDLDGASFIRDKYRSGIITAKCPEGKNGIIAFQVNQSKTKVTPIIKDGNARFLIEVKAKGRYDETAISLKHKPVTTQYLRESEKAFAKTIEKSMKDVLNKFQKQYNVDIFLFDSLLKRKKPEYWDQVKSKWDEIYPDVETEFKVDVKIQQYGNVE